jgi:hypothetical protein
MSAAAVWPPIPPGLAHPGREAVVHPVRDLRRQVRRRLDEVGDEDVQAEHGEPGRERRPARGVQLQLDRRERRGRRRLREREADDGDARRDQRRPPAGLVADVQGARDACRPSTLDISGRSRPRFRPKHPCVSPPGRVG